MASSCPEILFRHLRPDDTPALRLLHQRLFPLDYDASFYHAATGGLDGIVAWAAIVQLPSLTTLAVDGGSPAPQLHRQAWQQQQQQQPQQPQQHGQPAELLAGFITARVLPALYTDPNDRRLLGLDSEQLDQERLMYILTLGVAESYQRHGIARRLLDLALRSAAQAACRAVYLHVASFNEPALRLYRSAGFAELALLPGFYTIKTGREPVPGKTSYSASLFGCFIAPPGPTPWDAASLVLAPLTAVVGGLNACLPWSPAQQQPEAAGAAAATDTLQQRAGGGQQSQQPHQLDPEAQLPADLGQEPQWWPRSRPEAADSVLQMVRPPQLQPLQQSSSEVPEWLRALFTRR